MAASTKGWSLDFLLSKAPKTFRDAHRVSAKLPIDDLNAKIREYERSGLPLVIEGFHNLDIWPKEELNLDRFVERSAEDTVSVRNVHTWADSKVKLTDFVERSRNINPYVQENETERWYGKDMECPKLWEEWLRTGNVVPTMLLANGSQDLFRYRPESAPVQTLMCYLGVGDTFTPCHKDLCASSGQNLMCYTEKNGSSYWFMTASSTAPKASKYFQDLRQELDHENHVVTVEELAKAPFEVYVLEQKLGDLVLVPPRSCHQVVNFGGITLKTSWSRMTVKGLITAYYHEIPIYRRVCRPEIYKVKSTIFHAMIGKTRELGNLMPKAPKSNAKGRKPRTTKQDSSLEALANSLKELIPVVDAILSEEYDKMGETMPMTYNGSDRFTEESSLTCDFCGGDIFQSFFQCAKCVEGGNDIADRLHLCAGCYVEGRTCACSNLQPQQYGKFQDLIGVREKAVEAVYSYEHRRGNTFAVELKLRNEKLPQLFRAAYRLYSNRLKLATASKKERVCTSRQRHVASYYELLNCKGCHHSKCFTHILESHKVHVAQALLLHASDKTEKHEKYHANHLSKTATFKDVDELSALETNQAEGVGHTGYSQLVVNALNYSHCVPVRHAQYLRAGWYDNQIFMDEEESRSMIGRDGDTTHATTTRDSTPFSLDISRPALKITLLALRSNPPTAMTSSSLTRTSSLLSAVGSTLDATDIPITPEDYDSDNVPLTELFFPNTNYGSPVKDPQPPQPPVADNAPVTEDDMPLAPLPTVPESDSESADVDMVDAFIRGPADTETSPSPSPLEVNEHVVEEPPTPKRMIPYVLVPRLEARDRMKYDLPCARPYVLVPPAPYSIEHFRQQGAGFSHQQPPAQKAGLLQIAVSAKSSGPSELKTVSPVKKATTTITTTQTPNTNTTLPKKRKSDELTTNSKIISPPRPNPTVAQTYPKIVKARSGLVVRIIPKNKAALQAEVQHQQQRAKKVAAERTASRASFSQWSSSRKRESVQKWPPISKTRKEEVNGSADPPAPPVAPDVQQVASTSQNQSAACSSLQSSPSSSSNQPNDLRLQQQQNGLEQLSQPMGPITHGNVQQDALPVSQDLAGTLHDQPQSSNVRDVSRTSGDLTIQSPPTEPRQTRLQRQQALGQWNLPNAPWRNPGGGQGFYGRSGYGHHPDGRPHQNHKQQQQHPHSMHPYLKHQRSRDKFGYHHHKGIAIGPPGRSRNNSMYQSRAGAPFLIPNVKLQRLSYPDPDDVGVNNGEGAGAGPSTASGSGQGHLLSPSQAREGGGGDEEGRRSSTSIQPHNGKQPRVFGSPTFLKKSPPRQPRHHHLFDRHGAQHQQDRHAYAGQGQGDPSDLGWQNFKKSKGKGKGKMRERQREEEVDMDMDDMELEMPRSNPNPNSNSLFVRLGMVDRDMPGDEPDMSWAYRYRQGARKNASFSFVDNDNDDDVDVFGRQRPTISARRESAHSGRTEPPRKSHRTNNNNRHRQMDDERGHNMRFRTPTSGLATLVNEDSAPAFPETDSGLILNGNGQGSRAGGGSRVDVPDMDVDVDGRDLMQPVVSGGGEDEGYWEEEEGTEEEKEKRASEMASWRQEEEEDMPMRWEEEEGEEEEEEEEEEDEEEEEKEEIIVPPPLHMITSGATRSPEVDEEEEENTSQIWEYEYALEEQNELSGVYSSGLNLKPTAGPSSSLFLGVEEEDEYDEVSLGESEDDYVPSSMMALPGGSIVS